jgi:hypothetical protein
MEDFDQIILNIRFIHDYYLSDIIESTNLSQEIKNSIQVCKRNFDTNINRENLQATFRLLNKKLYKSTEDKGSARAKLSTESTFPVEYLNIASYIITCYNLNIYSLKDDEEEEKKKADTASKEEKKSEEFVALSESESLDREVEIFTLFYVGLYQTIEKYKSLNYNEQMICESLKTELDGLKCGSSLFRKFYNQAKGILSNLFKVRQIGGNKWKHKYLKYKKKYLNIKNKKNINI